MFDIFPEIVHNRAYQRGNQVKPNHFESQIMNYYAICKDAELHNAKPLVPSKHARSFDGATIAKRQRFISETFKIILYSLAIIGLISIF